MTFETKTFEKNELGISAIRMNILENRKENSPLARAKIYFKNGMALSGVSLWPKKNEDGINISLPGYKVAAKDRNGNQLYDENQKPVYEFHEYFHPTAQGTRTELNANLIAAYDEGMQFLSQAQNQNKAVSAPSLSR